jgi:DNA/RNA endonuclease YhcR with UshA esterase domain
LPPEEAAARVGAEVVVEMEVRSTGQERTGRLLFLNSRDDFSDPTNFTIVVPNSALGDGQSADEVMERYRRRRVRVAGMVETYRGKGQIRVDSLDQIQLLPDR